MESLERLGSFLWLVEFVLGLLASSCYLLSSGLHCGVFIAIFLGFAFFDYIPWIGFYGESSGFLCGVGLVLSLDALELEFPGVSSMRAFLFGFIDIF